MLHLNSVRIFHCKSKISPVPMHTIASYIYIYMLFEIFLAVRDIFNNSCNSLSLLSERGDKAHTIVKRRARSRRNLLILLPDVHNNLGEHGSTKHVVGHSAADFVHMVEVLLKSDGFCCVFLQQHGQKRGHKSLQTPAG